MSHPRTVTSGPVLRVGREMCRGTPDAGTLTTVPRDGRTVKDGSFSCIRSPRKTLVEGVTRGRRLFRNSLHLRPSFTGYATLLLPSDAESVHHSPTPPPSVAESTSPVSTFSPYMTSKKGRTVSVKRTEGWDWAVLGGSRTHVGGHGVGPGLGSHQGCWARVRVRGRDEGFLT